MKVIFLYCMGCDIEYQKLTAGVQFDLPHLESGGGASFFFPYIFVPGYLQKKVHTVPVFSGE